jgi:hypothetical protein
VTTPNKHVDVAAEGDRWSLGQLSEIHHVGPTFWASQVSLGRLTVGADGRVGNAGAGGLAAYLANATFAATLASEPKYV